MSNECKPCPFCGGTDILVQEHGEGYSRDNYWVAACFNPNCGEVGKTRAEAIELWNRRAAPQAVQASEPVARLVREGFSLYVAPALGTVEGQRALDELPSGTLLYAAPQPAAEKGKNA